MSHDNSSSFWKQQESRTTNLRFCLWPLAGIGNNLCIGADVPNSKDGIEQYFRHDVKFNNIKSKLRFRTLHDIGQLKRGRSIFCVYLANQRVYISKAQPGKEDGITLGWTLKAHPDFCYRDDMKKALYNMMGEEFKRVQYALLPKIIKYQRSEDGAKVTTNGITLQVAKTPGITAVDFRADMAEKWQRLTAKTGGTLFGKTCIPLVKEGGIGDEVMTTIIQQQNNLLRSTKQCIVQNLNDIDCHIDKVTGSAKDMDVATVTLLKIFYQYKDEYGGQLFDGIDKTNTGGTYRFIFHDRNTETVDNMLSNLDAILDAFGAWEDCDVHFIYMTARPIILVGRVAKYIPTAFWENHLSAFKANGIPAEIDTQKLQYNTKKRASWVRASYSDISKGRTPASITALTIANTSAQGKDVNITDSGIPGGSNRTGNTQSANKELSPD
jgi:hypothetical protein